MSMNADVVWKMHLLTVWLWPFKSQNHTISVISQGHSPCQFEHFGIIRLCCGQTNKQTKPNILPTPTDRIGVGIIIIARMFILAAQFSSLSATFNCDISRPGHGLDRVPGTVNARWNRRCFNDRRNRFVCATVAATVAATIVATVAKTAALIGCCNAA